MQNLIASINSIKIKMYYPKELSEYREGIRGLSKPLELEEGVFFNFGKYSKIQLENKDVPLDVRVLFFKHFAKYGTVAETLLMPKNSAITYTSIDTHWSALELHDSFCQDNKIGVGSLLVIDRGYY